MDIMRGGATIAAWRVPLLAGALALLLGSVSGARAEPTRKIAYVCENDVEVVATFLPGDPGSARVESKGESWTLPHVPSGSGAKYSSGAVTFWAKGKEALFDAPGSNLTCTAKP